MNMVPSLNLFIAALVFGAGFTLAFCVVQTLWNAAVGAVTKQ